MPKLYTSDVAIIRAANTAAPLYQSTNTFAIFNHISAAILIVAHYHAVAPTGEETLTSCEF